MAATASLRVAECSQENRNGDARGCSSRVAFCIHTHMIDIHMSSGLYWEQAHETSRAESPAQSAGRGDALCATSATLPPKIATSSYQLIAPSIRNAVAIRQAIMASYDGRNAIAIAYHGKLSRNVPSANRK